MQIRCLSGTLRARAGIQENKNWLKTPKSTDRGIHNSNCENRTPCVFPSQV